MRLITLSVAVALATTASASDSITSFNLNSSCIESEPKVRIFNRCPYTVTLWSVLKGMGCPSDEGAILEPGGWYQENFRPAVNGIGTSIKLSKSSQCKGVDCVQLEYYPETNNPGYEYNYLDVSYVDCISGDCPTKQEGFYLKSGNQNGDFVANEVNEICPILSCSNADECAKMAYILPDDRQTKSCDLKADLDFYMCGGDAPSDQPYQPPVSPEEDSPPKPSSSSSFSTSTTKDTYVANVTPPPEQSEPIKHYNVKTVIVTEYVNAKRHAHGHGHRAFRA